MDNLNLLCMGCMREKSSEGICPYCGFSLEKRLEENAQKGVHHLQPGSILNGRYMVGKVLGEGGFGITYIGWNLNLDIPIAIKEYFPNGFAMRNAGQTNTVSRLTGGEKEEYYVKQRKRFLDEAKILGKLEILDSIVSVKDCFAENGTAYIVMEYLDGEDFTQYLERKGGKLPAEQVFKMMEPIVKALILVHKNNGLIHRDISPQNIRITSDGRVKLMDFGAARETDDEKSLSVLLKRGYAPEEQYRTRGKQGPWTDVYGLCATMYRAITGTKPIESLDRIVEDELKQPSQLGITIKPKQEEALMKGLAVLAKDRWQSMEELYEALYHVEEKIVDTVDPIRKKENLNSKERKENKQNKEDNENSERKEINKNKADTQYNIKDEQKQDILSNYAKKDSEKVVRGRADDKIEISVESQKEKSNQNFIFLGIFGICVLAVILSAMSTAMPNSHNSTSGSNKNITTEATEVTEASLDHVEEIWQQLNLEALIDGNLNYATVTSEQELTSWMDEHHYNWKYDQSYVEKYSNVYCDMNIGNWKWWMQYRAGERKSCIRFYRRGNNEENKKLYNKIIDFLDKRLLVLCQNEETVAYIEQTESNTRTYFVELEDGEIYLTIYDGYSRYDGYYREKVADQKTIDFETIANLPNLLSMNEKKVKKVLGKDTFDYYISDEKDYAGIHAWYYFDFSKEDGVIEAMNYLIDGFETATGKNAEVTLSGRTGGLSISFIIETDNNNEIEIYGFDDLGYWWINITAYKND